MLNKLLSAVIITAFLFSLSSTLFAQRPAEADRPQIATEFAPTPENAELQNDPERVKARLEAQIKRLSADYDLSPDQETKALEIYTQFEMQQIDLKNRINILNKERQSLFEDLLTSEQKEKFEKSKIERRERITAPSKGEQDTKRAPARSSKPQGESPKR